MMAFWGAFAGALAAVAMVAGVVATVRRHNRALAELRKVAHRYRVPSPWWKRWYQPVEEWDELARARRR